MPCQPPFLHVFCQVSLLNRSQTFKKNFRDLIQFEVTKPTGQSKIPAIGCGSHSSRRHEAETCKLLGNLLLVLHGSYVVWIDKKQIQLRFSWRRSIHIKLGVDLDFAAIQRHLEWWGVSNPSSGRRSLAFSSIQQANSSTTRRCQLVFVIRRSIFRIFSWSRKILNWEKKNFLRKFLTRNFPRKS